MKRLLLVFITLTLVAALASPVLAASSRRGKRTFKKECKTCHVEGAEGGKISPLQKTQAQWREFFKKNQHQVKPDVWKKLSDKERENLLKFFLDFALDSDQPETCG
ncbi:MAG: cytochrome c [Deltaproteobacteria bacterium]|nr:cytochrome c [Deltaproteobacteria bacterium]NCP03706.1 cytochrome c [Deltaproteobacteria bacterium]